MRASSPRSRPPALPSPSVTCRSAVGRDRGEGAVMQIEFLGSGGALPTPRVGCQCRVCTEARAKGVPYSRGGPSVFVHGPDLLIDTPEEIRDLLNRSRVTRIA